MIQTMNPALAVGLTLLALPISGSPVGAQIISAAHDDAEWEHDRQPPYAGAGWLESDGGSVAIDFPSSGIDLRSWISLPEFDPDTNAANDCWGYVAPSGREYALIGLSLGTAFVEVTDPGNAQIIDVITGPTSSWRDIKTHQQFAYAVSEGGGGIQVFDLSQIDSGVVSLVNTITTGGRLQTHDVAINTESGRLYRVGGGGNSPVNGLRVYSLADPSTPAFLGKWHDRYCHDAQVVTWTDAPYVGVEVAFCYANDTTASGNPGIEILDVSDPANISVIGSINLSLPPIFSHPAYYAHQGWLSPDRQYVYFNDEVDEASTGNSTTTRIIDVSDLSNPIQAATFTNGNPARDHNLYTKGELLFESNYRSGLRVFSASDPLAPLEIAYFDTYPDDDNANYNGLWSVYPYFPSGTIIGSDIERGLFVWTFAVAPVPALSARGSLATVFLIAILATMTLRHRRPPGRTASLITAALVAIGLGCGPQESPDPVVTKQTQSEPEPDRPLPPFREADPAEMAPSSAPRIPDRAPSAETRSGEKARGDRMEPTRDAYATEQAELLSKLDSPDPEVRAEAADWIDLDRETLERMISLLESDPNADVRATIVERLGEEDSPAAIAALVAALQDPDSEVVLRAIEILEFEAEAWLIPELERLLSHPDPEVREFAQDAIDFLEE
jgi:choice-of-anchor B domain-containing protein